MVDFKTLPDNELIDLVRESNHTAYTEIYHRYHQLLITFALKKLNDPELTKDIVQEVFLALWTKRSQLTEIGNLPGYLTTLTKNKILNLFDHEKVKSKYASSLATHSSNYQISDTDHKIREKQLAYRISLELHSLPKKMRQSFVLSRINNLSNREIAAKLNTSDHNISQHINNAIRILKAKLIALF